MSSSAVRIGSSWAGRGSQDVFIKWGAPRPAFERSLILTSGRQLRLAESLGKAELLLPGAGGPLKQDLKGVERSRILEALQASSWRIKGKDNAASRLGLKSSTLRSRMKRPGIERPH